MISVQKDPVLLRLLDQALALRLNEFVDTQELRNQIETKFEILFETIDENDPLLDDLNELYEEYSDVKQHENSAIVVYYMIKLNDYLTKLAEFLEIGLEREAS